MAYTQIQLQTSFHIDFLVAISYYKLSAAYARPGETHPFWEFVYVDRGSVVVTAGADTYYLNAGEMVFHRPGEFHDVRPIGQADIIVACFGCESEAMQRLEHKVILLHTREKNHLKLLIEEAQHVYTYFENEPAQIDLSKKESAPWGSDQLIKTYLEQFLIYVCRRDDNVQLSQRSVSSERLHHNLVLKQQATDYLAEHYNERITLDSLASALGISVPQLKRLFREQIGQSMVAYLTALRISEAKRLIRQGQITFTQVAEAVGYENIYYFSTLFKKQTGLTPTEYAKSLKD